MTPRLCQRIDGGAHAYVVAGDFCRPEIEIPSKEMEVGSVGQRRVIAAFDGGDVTSDSGVLLV